MTDRAEPQQPDARRFPIQASTRVTSIPWSLIAPHERQAQTNHSQTLERLAQRHGLDPTEAVAVLTDRPWRDVFTSFTQEAAEDFLLSLSLVPEPQPAIEIGDWVKCGTVGMVLVEIAAKGLDHRGQYWVGAGGSFIDESSEIAEIRKPNGRVWTRHPVGSPGGQP